jgi:hypothetical protein
MNLASDQEALRYLDAAHVEHPTGTLAGFDVCSECDERLGSLGGVLVEPAQRRIRYFVVERAAILRKGRYLLSADHLATLDPETGTIHIDAGGERIERFDPATVPAFSDDDLIETIFARPA